MSATLLVEHKVGDYAAWRKVYDGLEPLRAKHGCTGQRVMRLPDDGDNLRPGRPHRRHRSPAGTGRLDRPTSPRPDRGSRPDTRDLPDLR
jgi:hypothetical protein